MAGCGYVCPVCEGRGYTDEGKACDYCAIRTKDEGEKGTAVSDEEWMKRVHDHCSCSDIGEEEKSEEEDKNNRN